MPSSFVLLAATALATVVTASSSAPAASHHHHHHKFDWGFSSFKIHHGPARQHHHHHVMPMRPPLPHPHVSAAPPLYTEPIHQNFLMRPYHRPRPTHGIVTQDHNIPMSGHSHLHFKPTTMSTLHGPPPGPVHRSPPVPRPVFRNSVEPFHHRSPLHNAHRGPMLPVHTSRQPEPMYHRHQYGQPEPYPVPESIYTPAPKHPEPMYHHSPFKHPEPMYHHPVSKQPEPMHSHSVKIPEPMYHHPARKQPEPMYQHPVPKQPESMYHNLAPKNPEPMYHQPQLMNPHPDPMYHPEATIPVPPAPKFLGRFANARNDVSGDIYMLDEGRLLVRGFSFDGAAPDAHFWSDGVSIPYYRAAAAAGGNADRQMLDRLGRFRNEDLVLVLPPERRPAGRRLGRLSVWCKKFGVNFGEFEVPPAHQ